MHISAQKVEDLGLSLPQLETRLLEWVNRERITQKLPVLTLHATLSDVARRHSQKMADEKKLSHDFANYPTLSNRLADAGLYFTAAGENVASGESFIMSLIHQALMNSPRHRENLISSDYNQIGVGIVFDGQLYYVTQAFVQGYVPQPSALMEENLVFVLSTRLGPRHPLTMALTSEIQTLCRTLADGFIQGKQAQPVPAKLGQTTVTTVTFTNVNEGANMLLSYASHELPLAWTLGVAFGRSKDNPGGIYAVSLLSFPKSLRH